MVDAAGHTVLETSDDLTAPQAERDAQKARADKMTAQRDQARTELATVTADHFLCRWRDGGRLAALFAGAARRAKIGWTK